MPSTEPSRPRRRRARVALVAALVAVGCSGGTGGGCGSSCGGAFQARDGQGNPIRFTGPRLDNVAQVRVTQSGFTFLNAQHLNDVIGQLNGDSSVSQSFRAPDGGGTLSFWYRVICPPATGHGWATATLRDGTAGTAATVLPQTCTNTGSYAQVTAALAAGHDYTLVLSNHDGSDAASATYTEYDDVAVAGAFDPVRNGGFESGLTGWTGAGTTGLVYGARSGALAMLVGSTSPGFALPCIDAGTLLDACNIAGFIDITRIHLLVGDSALSGDPATCAVEKTPLHMTFRDVSWVLDPVHNVLKAHLVLHLKTGDIYLRTVEEHSTLCGGTSAIQARVLYDDTLPGLPQPYTVADLSIHFTTAPDGRLEFNFDDASLAGIVASFQPAALVIDGLAGNDPAPPATAAYNGNGCDAASGTYSTTSGGELSCAGVLNGINANCDVTVTPDGGLCAIVQYVRGYVFDYLKNAFKDRIVKVLRTQLDNVRCQRSADSTGAVHACDAAHACPADDDGSPLACDEARGVCYPPAQGLGADGYNCEPAPLAIAGRVDVSDLTQKVGFPPGTRLDVFAGLGSKGPNGGATVDPNGIQLAVEAGTQPASDATGLCAPPAPPPAGVAAVPPLDFDDAANKPVGVGAYDFGFSLASAMLNRGFLDAYNAGLLCVAVTNATTSFVSSGLFKTFLPSLGLVTGGKDVPMRILLRPTRPPSVRIGKNTTRLDAGGNQVPDDPLITLTFNQLALDFYALVDERQVRLFTLQADLQLPLDLRTFADPNADTLQPVLGSLDTVLTNVSALSPDGGAYSAAADMLAEDPGVVKDLLGAAVRLAQPLLAGVIKPIALPSILGLKFAIRGVAGAVPTSDVATGGYQHLAVWAQVGACGGSTGIACQRYTVEAQARIAGTSLPESLDQVRAGARPGVELELSAPQARARPEFSYRVDGSLWSPWIGAARITLRDPLFLVQGHHRIEVTAREGGDDHSMDPTPVALDFFVSYEPPTVALVQRPDDGAIVTRGRSPASRAAQLSYSYRVDGEQGWTDPGPARVFTQETLGGRGLTVRVSDEAGRAAQAHFGEEEGAALARAGVTGGCASSPRAPAWPLLPLLALLLLRRRQRKGSSPAG